MRKIFTNTCCFFSNSSSNSSDLNTARWDYIFTQIHDSLKHNVESWISFTSYFPSRCPSDRPATVLVSSGSTALFSLSDWSLQPTAIWIQVFFLEEEKPPQQHWPVPSLYNTGCVQLVVGSCLLLLSLQVVFSWWWGLAYYCCLYSFHSFSLLRLYKVSWALVRSKT